MLRYLAQGPKDLAIFPVQPIPRFNWEFYILLRGELRPIGPGLEEEPLATAPTLWVFPPDRMYGWRSPRRIERAVFHFSSAPEPIREACVARGFLCVALQPADVEMIRGLARSLEPHYRAPSSTSLLLFDRALIDLCLILMRGHDLDAVLPLETLAVERVERATEWYVAHICERPTIEALASVVHVSATQLRRHFRAVHRLSPHQVLTRLRLDKATQLLANTGDTLDVVARQSGFNSASDLCRVFKSRFKTYPKEWRTQVASREAIQPEDQARRLLARVDPKAGVLADRQRKQDERRKIRGKRSVAKV